MPYIPPNARGELTARGPASDGEANYVVTRTIVNYLGTVFGYTDLNAAIGVLECAKLELYRCVVAPYEDEKRRENGDVYFTPPTLPWYPEGL